MDMTDKPAESAVERWHKWTESEEYPEGDWPDLLSTAEELAHAAIAALTKERDEAVAALAQYKDAVERAVGTATVGIPSDFYPHNSWETRLQFIVDAWRRMRNDKPDLTAKLAALTKERDEAEAALATEMWHRDFNHGLWWCAAHMVPMVQAYQFDLELARLKDDLGKF